MNEKLAKMTAAQAEKYQEKIDSLQEALTEAELKGLKALSMAQQTKRGHVYVISNIGSFGENVFKIGMTRRLDPQDRVDELGSASVPFLFDIHAMIHSEDAPRSIIMRRRQCGNKKLTPLRCRLKLRRNSHALQKLFNPRYEKNCLKGRFFSFS